MAEVARLIDDLYHANFSIPSSNFARDRLGLRDSDNEVDDAVSYSAAHFELRTAIGVDELGRLNKINALFLRALQGKHLTQQRVRPLLTADELRHYSEYLKEPAASTEVLYGDGIPSELRQYQRLLKEADFAYAKFDAASARRSSRRRGDTLRSPELLYERALEHLEEIYYAAERGHASVNRERLDAWMDRTIDFERGAERSIGADAVLIPRVRGSKSINAQDAGLPRLGKRAKQQWAALMTLLEVAVAIAFVLPTPAPNAALGKQVRERMHRMRSLTARALSPERDD